MWWALTAVRETVDDVASGAETREWAEEISKNMEVIIAKGGFKFKKAVMLGDKGEPMKVLGTGWDTERDTLFLEVKINVSRPQGTADGARPEPQ